MELEVIKGALKTVNIIFLNYRFGGKENPKR